jgi:hypothetical protein
MYIESMRIKLPGDYHKNRPKKIKQLEALLNEIAYECNVQKIVVDFRYQPETTKGVKK